MEQNSVQKLPGWRLIMFALGQFGWSLGSWSVGNALNYFYMPPEKAETGALFPTFIFQGAVLGIATIIGLINAGGRVWDAITDPIIANMSDRSRSKFGKRRIFLAISAIPTALFAFFVFFPIADGSTQNGMTINAIWLAVSMFLYYIFITMYCTPYNSLIAELGHTPNERLNISTAISITWALGAIVGNLTYSLIPLAKSIFNVDQTRAFQIVVGIFELIAALCMLLPVLFIDEKKYAETHASEQGVIASVVSTFKNSNFRWFVFSDLPYWVALNFIQMGITYYIITLLGLEETLPTTLMAILFILSFVFYIPINIVAKKLGKKPMLTAAFAIFMFVFFLTFFFGWLPLPNRVQAFLVIIIASLPIAIFGILPNAIVADIADAHGIETGVYQAGIFFGARTFMMKMGISVANFLFPSILLLGKSPENPWGIRISALAAVGFCLLGMLLFLQYNEKHVLKVLSEKEQLSQEELKEINS